MSVINPQPQEETLMKNLMLATGMLLAVILGGCGGPEGEFVPETGQEVEALTEDSKTPACGWLTIYKEWQCVDGEWDDVTVATAKFDCFGNYTPPERETDCYKYYEFPCNSMNPCYDEVEECPPEPWGPCRSFPSFPNTNWQFLAP
jgi:hypothetical protein